MGFEPTTFCLASRRSTPELRPLFLLNISNQDRAKLPERIKAVNLSEFMFNVFNIKEEKNSTMFVDTQD